MGVLFTEFVFKKIEPQRNLCLPTVIFHEKLSELSCLLVSRLVMNEFIILCMSILLKSRIFILLYFLSSFIFFGSIVIHGIILIDSQTFDSVQPCLGHSS